MSENMEPTENEVYLMSGGPSGDSDPFTGIDAFGPDGPVPLFGVPPVVPSPPSVSCVEVQRGLQVYLDDEMLPAQADLVRAHLHSCLACQSAQLFQTELRTVVARKALDSIPPEVRSRITRALGLD